MEEIIRELPEMNKSKVIRQYMEQRLTVEICVLIVGTHLLKHNIRKKSQHKIRSVVECMRIHADVDLGIYIDVDVDIKGYVNVDVDVDDVAKVDVDVDVDADKLLDSSYQEVGQQSLKLNTIFSFQNIFQRFLQHSIEHIKVY